MPDSRFSLPAVTLALTLLLAGCGAGGDASFAIAEDDQALEVGDDLALTLEGAASAEWDSSNASVATVDGGLVRAVAEGEATITAADPANATHSDAITVTVHAASTALWTRQFGTATSDTAQGVALDGDGHVLVAGDTGAALDGPHQGSADVFAREFAADGTGTDWTRHVGSAAYDVAAALGVDADGDARLVGDTEGTVGGPSTGLQDAVAVALQSDGSVDWAEQIGTSAIDTAFDLAVDGSGNVLLTGRTFGALQGANVGGSDAFVTKLDASGSVVWTRQFGTAASDTATSVAVDGSGDAFVAGFTGGALEGSSAGGDDAFLRKIASDGGTEWTRQFGTAQDDHAGGVATDVTGSALVVGDTRGGLAGGHQGSEDAFARKVDANGRAVWTRQFGTAQSDVAHDVEVGGNGRAFLVGTTYGALQGSSAGVADVFTRELDAYGAVVRTRQFGTSAHDTGLAAAVGGSGKAAVAGATRGTLEGSAAGEADAFVRTFGPP